MSKETKNTKTKNTETQSTNLKPVISEFVKDGTLGLQQNIRDGLTAAFPVQKIETLLDAEMLMDGAGVLSSHMSLVACKTAEKVYNDELWRNGSYMDNNGKAHAYKNYAQWAMRKYNLSNSAAFALLRVAKLIEPNGFGSLLPHTTGADFSYSKLSELAGSPVFIRSAKVEGAEDGRKNEYIFLAEDGSDVEKIEDSALYFYCAAERITPAMTIRDIRAFIKKLKSTDEDEDELLTTDQFGNTTTTDNTTDNTTTTDEAATTDEGAKVYKLSLSAEMFNLLIACVNTVIDSEDATPETIQQCHELLGILHSKL